MIKGARFSCPHCRGYILVGDHSITIDRERIAEERTKRIEAAARELVSYYTSDGDVPQIARKLRDALAIEVPDCGNLPR